ncbi:glyoxalase/bleomycin resistance protein/dioxygenase [Saccharomonospora azurea SZMC 14600]|uniref:VOC family protein n=1 Tax=Saccharomonospora azurea TaxID=40988 RepID=UPI00023FFBAF|nr:VOC family protein [Saccharomonospora azurea]EHK88275.1 glyoxalase/bleomycin resistance protein/dioxygenase [Saccharomonospora azurea SZMC 14600]
MGSSIENIVVDCADAYELGRWWSRVLNVPLSAEDQPGDPETLIELGDRNILFIQVPEPKTVKNRLHFCLRPDVPRDEEVQRLLGIGATLVDDRRRPDGTGWAVLADPEGNEFCVLRGAHDDPPRL